MKTENRRLGRFVIDYSFVEDETQHPLLLKVFERTIVLRCELIALSMKLEYHALCADFDVVELGQETPFYQVIVSSSGLVTFEKTNLCQYSIKNVFPSSISNPNHVGDGGDDSVSVGNTPGSLGAVGEF